MGGNRVRIVKMQLYNVAGWQLSGGERSAQRESRDTFGFSSLDEKTGPTLSDNLFNLRDDFFNQLEIDQWHQPSYSPRLGRRSPLIQQCSEIYLLALA